MLKKYLMSIVINIRKVIHQKIHQNPLRIKQISLKTSVNNFFNKKTINNFKKVVSIMKFVSVK